MIGSGHSRLAYDTTDRAGVDDEVLPEFLGGADAGIGRDTTDIGGTLQVTGGGNGVVHKRVFLVGFVTDQYQPTCSECCHALDGLP